MHLNWQTCTGNKWCSFEKLTLSHKHFNEMEGVYIIWHAGNPRKIVYVGQGNIAARIQDHRDNKEILQYRTRGVLMVTWAKVHKSYQDGIERYLADRFHPLAGDAWPNVTPIAVNSPWE